ncbi:hypothetical protein BD779DRAFT_1218200 [Infundibulicybe gibba]|nr:hypothetical protein BD779DRAFT_1218200 [Infundibulicybe gibba]
MSFWYPDNINRRDRAQQLSNDITVMQQAVAEAKVEMDKALERMDPYIQEMFRNNGMKTFDDLKAKLDASLTPEQKMAYDELVQRSKKTTDGIDNALTVFSAMTFYSGIAVKAIDITSFLISGHVISTFRAYGKAFITLITEGLEAGKAASKLGMYASRASKVLKTVAALGIIADAFILALAIYQEAQQREYLRAAINDLFVRRIISKFYERMCDSIKTHNGLMISYLLFVSGPEISAEDQSAADKIAKKMSDFVTEDWENIDTASSYDLLSALDSARTSWRDEDPSRESALQQADQDISPDNVRSTYPRKCG